MFNKMLERVQIAGLAKVEITFGFQINSQKLAASRPFLLAPAPMCIVLAVIGVPQGDGDVP